MVRVGGMVLVDRLIMGMAVNLPRRRIHHPGASGHCSLDYVGGADDVDRSGQSWLLPGQVNIANRPDVDDDIVARHGCRDGVSGGEVTNNRLAFIVVDLIESGDFPTLIAEVTSYMTP